AALKQVPTLEYNPFEAVKTNILGSQNVIEAAVDQGVKRVVLISTDKAAQPVNLYGSTKLCAEKLFISGNSYTGNKTKFSCVRYGNVIGSRGSIIEVLLKNPNLDTVYITDEKMTRFWLLLQKSFDLVLFALNNMEGGEIFIPKVPSMRLVKLFEIMAPNSKREIIGIRPGEKIHEILLTEQEARHSVELNKYYVVIPEFLGGVISKNKYAKYFETGQKINENFRYTSDGNSEWLTKKKFKELIKNLY
ncbi:polysaccharide biosynthesis protein, partial [bacterium]|nr:polysaccharide biosynthesis protein [bacterium]